jgi:hypothetical protein
MKLFKFKKWQLIVSEEIWGLLPFKALLDRDKTKDKVNAMKEMLFIYFYYDIKSNYLHMSPEEKLSEITKDIGLPKNWVIDKEVQIALDFYRMRSVTIIQKLYEDTLVSAQAIGSYLKDTELLLKERDVHGKPVYDITKITNANEKIPKLMANLKAAYKEVVKEQEDNENKKKGSKSFNMFEEGFGGDSPKGGSTL